MAAQLNASQIAALFDGPALQPPDGTIPNFYDFSDKSISNGYSAFLIISLVISTLGVLGRCYVKACIIKSLQLDDCEFDAPERFYTREQRVLRLHQIV